MSSDSTGDDDSSPQPKISIRQMEIDDLADVYHLGESLFTSKALPVLYRTWDPYEVTYYYSGDPDFCLVAETDSETIVGFLLGGTVDKDGSSWRYGYLAWLGIKQEYQGRRIAHRLLHEFERRMKEAGVRMLLVDTEGDNDRALDFFKSHGFNHPSAHVWLSKSLSQRQPSLIKSTKPLVVSRVKPAAGVHRHQGSGPQAGESLELEALPPLALGSDTA